MLRWGVKIEKQDYRKESSESGLGITPTNLQLPDSRGIEDYWVKARIGSNWIFGYRIATFSKTQIPLYARGNKLLPLLYQRKARKGFIHLRRRPRGSARGWMRKRQLNESGAQCLMLRWISPPVDNPPKPWRRRVFQWRYHGLCPWGSISKKSSLSLCLGHF